MAGEYGYTGGVLEVTESMKKDFAELGYIIVRGLLQEDELLKLTGALEHDEGILKHAFEVPDGTDRNSKLCVWNQPGNDITGMVGRCQKVAGVMDKLLGGEVYHYHTKLMMKEARTGGRHVWHQDYGYWYKNGCLFPDMATAFIALDKCEKANGCLQVLPGSQKCGRIEHVFVGGQQGAHLDRVNQINDKLAIKYVEMAPGDALFFHCNLLHRSAKNDSEHRRWAFLCAYNRASNNPIKLHHHASFTPLLQVDNDAIRNSTVVTNLEGKDFMDPKTDETIKPK